MELDSHILTEDTQATLLLCGVFPGSTESDLQPLALRQYNRLADWLMAQQMRPVDLLHDDGLERLSAATLDLPDLEQIERLLNRGAALALAVEAWTDRGLWVLSRSDEDYPQRLRQRLQRKAPPILYGAGDSRLLEMGGLGVVGSRHVDSAVLDFTREVAHCCVLDEILVISGGAHGIDQAAMVGALEMEGCVVAVLSGSLERAALESAARRALAEERLALISPYAPHAGFSVGQAMGRNKLIYALSDWTLVVSADFGKGGTWTGATENLKNGWAPVVVRSGRDVPQGNLKLVEHGAVALEEATCLDESQSLRTLLNALPTPSLQPEPAQPALPLDEPIKAPPSVLSSSIGPEELWQQIIWPVLYGLLVEEEGTVTSDQFKERLNIVPLQANAWLKRAVQEGKVKRRLKPVRYELVEDKQIPLIES